MNQYAYTTFKRLFTGRRYREAAQLAGTTARKEGENRVFWYNQQATALLRLNRTDDALTALGTALQLDPASWLSLQLKADALFLSGDTKAALSTYQELESRGTSTDQTRRGILDCYIKSGQFDDAQTLFLATPPHDATWYPYKVRLLYALGEVAECISTCKQWITTAPKNRAAARKLAELEPSADTNEAENTSKATPEKEPPGAIRKRAFALAKSGKEQEALPLLEEQIMLTPTDRYCHNSYTAAARRAGRLYNAMQFYRMAIDIYPEERVLWFWLEKCARDQQQLHARF